MSVLIKKNNALVPVGTTFRIKTAEPNFVGVVERSNPNPVIPEGTTSIGAYAFYLWNDNNFPSNKGLRNITLPNSLTSIGNYAFNGCNQLILTSLPNNITNIGINAFQGCSGLALTSLSSGLTRIKSSVFSGCTNLALTNLPSSITQINSSAFSKCSHITSMDMPSVVQIDSSVFSNCTLLSSITLRSPTVCTLENVNAFTSTPISSGTGHIYVPADLVDSYKTATNWSTYANIIESIPT